MLIIEQELFLGIKIVLNNNEEFSGKVIGYDSKTDIAVIKVDKAGLTPAKFGDSDNVKVGAVNLIRNAKTMLFDSYKLETLKTYLTNENGTILVNELGQELYD